MRPTIRTTILAAIAVALATMLAACGGGSSGDGKKQQGEVVITCASCQSGSTDPFLNYHYDLVQSFNRKYAGRYRVEIKENQYAVSGDTGARLQYFQRLALANQLPDVFNISRGEITQLKKSGKLMDFAPFLQKDQQWRSAFYPDSFDPFKGNGTQILAVPEQRDAVGIYYNKSIFHAAGISEFPKTWDEFAADCAKIKAAGKACMAMDGGWTTLLMWANLIGTQDGGPQFLSSGIAGDDYASNPAVVKASETLKTWHADGYANRDAFSGRYEDASAPFLSGEAATIANGPWMVSTDIKGKQAIKGLYDETGYAPSPGWTPGAQGIAVAAGEGGWASGSRDEGKKEATIAFLKFMDARPQALEQTRKTGAYPAVKMDFSAAESKTLEPLAAGLVKETSGLQRKYPHAFYASPGGFNDAWKNLWPAYVKGKLSTQKFLTQLAQDAKSPTK
jgi:ABC-type glycerol-3-phosphate transport system substrate-binding protein